MGGDGSHFSLVQTEVGVLHQIQLIDGIDGMVMMVKNPTARWQRRLPNKLRHRVREVNLLLMQWRR